MFVHYFTHVALPASAAVDVLAGMREPMAEWAGLAYRQGEELRSRVGPGLGVPAKEVTFLLGPPTRAGEVVTFPMAWHATGAPSLFPRLSADLTVAGLGPELTVLTLQGTYDPPLGVVGRLFDRVGLGLIAEAAVKTWLDRVGSALSAVVVVDTAADRGMEKR